MTDEPEFQYIADEDHYEKVIERIRDCKKTLWIGVIIKSCGLVKIT